LQPAGQYLVNWSRYDRINTVKSWTAASWQREVAAQVSL